MKKFTIMTAFCAMAMLLGLTGCEQIAKATRVEPVRVSPFIPQRELLVPQKATFPFHYFYLKKDAGVYKNVYIAPVNTKYLRENKSWAKLDQETAKLVGSGIDDLAVYTKEAFCQEFDKAKGPNNLRVVADPNQAERTLIVEVAIVAIKPTKAELNILGTAGNLLLPGIGIITGKLAEGSVTIECVITDAKTKEIIAMFANTEKDQRAILNFAGMTWYTSAENNIKNQADYTARVFSGADYSSMHRRLIKIIEF